MDYSLTQSFKYNRNLTAHYAKSFYMATLLLPRKYRNPVFALYGFCRYADNMIDNPRRRSEEEIVDEVHCFGEELKIAYRSGESEHPVLCAFIHVAKDYGLPMQYPLELLKGVTMDVSRKRYKNFKELYLFSYRVAGVVGIMMTHLLGYRDDRAFAFAEKLGVAMQLTNILRDIQEDKNRGRIYLPQDELKHFGVTTQDILEERMSDGLRELMKFSAERAHRYYEEAKEGIPWLEKECQFAIHAAGKLYKGILHQIEERGFDPFTGRAFVPHMEKILTILLEYSKSKLIRNYQLR